MSFQPLEHDIEDQSTPADRWTLYRCSGWAWTRLGHPQSRGDEARAETTDHFILSPTKRSKSEVDLAGEPLLAELLEAMYDGHLQDRSFDYSGVLSTDAHGK